uniref:Uncharacterized protein n=1 Tax=Pantoea phage Survivor TaxID=3232176 RepID=A0AAU8KZB7_9CAUD
MKHVLTFTDYIENIEDGRYSIELVARLNQTEYLKAIARPISASAPAEAREAMFHQQLSSMALQAALWFQNRGIDFAWANGMTVFEQLSLFDVKQTASFNNELHAAGRKTDIMFVGL